MKPTKRVTKLKTLKQFQNMVESNQVVFIDRLFNRKCLKSFRKQVRKIIQNDPKVKTLAIVINSWGGLSCIADQMRNEILALKSKYDIWMIAGGITASAGAITLLSLPINRRVALPISSLYNHKPHSSTTERTSVNLPELRYTNNEDRAAIRDIRRAEKLIIKQIASETHLTKRQAKRLVKKKPRYLPAEKAKKLGFFSTVLK